jgi:hypothetical protein
LSGKTLRALLPERTAFTFARTYARPIFVIAVISFAAIWLQLEMLDIVLAGFVGLTVTVMALALANRKPKPAPRPKLAGARLLTVAGKIANPNGAGPDPAVADGLFRRGNLFFPAAVVYDVEALAKFENKQLKFAGPNQTNVYEGPDLKALLKDAGTDATLAMIVAHGAMKVLPLPAAALNSGAWIVALKCNGASLAAGDYGPLLLVHHPGGEQAAEDRSRWVSGLFFIDAK